MEFTEMQAQEAARSAGIDLEKERFDLKALTAGMNAELEHGTASPDTNITNATSRDALELDEMGRRFGFDVRLRYTRTDAAAISKLEKPTIKGNVKE